MSRQLSTNIRATLLAALLATTALGTLALPARAADDCTEVKVMVGAGPEEDVLAKYAASDFEKATGVKATVDTVARDVHAQRSSAEFVNDAGQYDVVAIAAGDDKLWVGRAHSLDMNKLLPKNVVDNIVPHIRELATMEDGKLMAVPQYWNAPMYFYRKDLFADPKNQADFKAKYGYDLGPPTTWDHLADIADFFNRPPNLYGGFVNGVAWAATYDFYDTVFGQGGDISDLKTNVLTLDSPQVVKALTILQRLSKVAPPGYQTESFFEADKLMQAGKLAAYWNWSYIWATLSKSPNKYAMATTPGDGIQIGGFWVAVPQAAPHPACAAKFLSWMLGDDYQTKQMAATGNPAATITVMNDTAATSKIPDFEAYLATSSKLKIDAVTWARELGEGTSAAVADVYAGKKTPQQAADWLQNVKFKGRKPIE